jgi:two-component system NtrC family response regulator
VDLTNAIKEGRFREDLYFRLAVVVCKLPPLRDRGEDIILLAKDFLMRFGKQNGCDNLSFDSQAIKAIASHPWPGNVRELQNRIQRAVIMADSRRISCEDLEIVSVSVSKESGNSVNAGTKVDVSQAGGLKEARETLERELVNQSLDRNEGNISAAAKDLGISRPTFYELMNKLGISKD